MAMRQEIKDGKGNVQIHGDGNRVILAADHIYQVVNDIHSEEDINPSIIAIRKHLEELQLHKGLRDARIFLLLVVTASFSIAIFRWDPYSIPLAVIGAVGIYLGQKQERFVSRVNTEIAAGNAVLMELYKLKLFHQINDKK
jgi:hypothetical protein